MRSVVIGLAVVGAATAAGADEHELGRQLVARDYAAIESQFDGPMRAQVPAGTLARLFEQVTAEIGPLRACRFVRPEYVRCTGEKPPAVDVMVTFKGGKIGGLSIKPEARDPEPAKTRLRPPFVGTFTARNADRDEGNPHYVNRYQRFAVDWLITDDKGQTFTGDPKQLASYYAYGKPAVAVAAGRVAMVIDGVPERPPGKMDAYNVGGNQVAIELAAGEYAYYAHLQPGSIRVKVGERVVAGQPIGLIGNSGNTSEPHLHFQMSTQPLLIDAQSMPAQFADVFLDGKRVVRAWPTSGQRLSSEAPTDGKAVDQPKEKR